MASMLLVNIHLLMILKLKNINTLCIFLQFINAISSEILPIIRWIRSLIENKSPQENVTTQIEGLRNLVTRIITMQQELTSK